jgi:hypothetical protein
MYNISWIYCNGIPARNVLSPISLAWELGMGQREFEEGKRGKGSMVRNKMRELL